MHHSVNGGLLPKPSIRVELTGLQVKLAEVLGGAEGDYHHTVPEDVLPCGHLESDLCAGDETVLLDHRVNSLHPAIPEVYPVERDKRINIRRDISRQHDHHMVSDVFGLDLQRGNTLC